MNSKTQNFLRTSRQQAAGSRQQAAGSRQQAAGSRQQAAGKHYSKNLTPRFSVSNTFPLNFSSGNSFLKLVKKYCPNGVGYKELNTVCDFQNGFAFKSNTFTSSGFPILRITNIVNGYLSNDDYVFFNKNSYKEDLSRYIVKKGDIVVAMSGATTGKIGYNNTDKIYYLNQRVGLFLPNKKFLNNRFLYHWLLSQSQNILNCSCGTGAQPNLSTQTMMKFQIPIPPLPVQEEIVRILDKFTNLTAELEAELEARKKQYEFYRDKLLTFDNTELNAPNKQRIEYRSLEEVCYIFAGGDIDRNNYSKEKTSSCKIPVVTNGVGDNSLYGYTNSAKILEPAVTISARGTIGYAEYRDYPYYPIIRLLSVIPKDSKFLNVKYLYYCMQIKKYNVPKTGIPQLTKPMLSNEKIAIPPLSTQQKIVSILDRFNALCTDLTSGLPAEIEARKKQYEYYRDKLLTFNKL